MSKSLIYAANTDSQSVVTTGTVVNFGSVVRRYGCNTNLSGGNVVVSGSGYYSIDTNINFIPSSAATATITVYKEGVAVPGASTTITATAGDEYAVSIPAVIRQTCCCETTITVVISGITGTVSNAAIEVIKQ